MTKDEMFDAVLGGVGACDHASEKDIERVKSDKNEVLYASYTEGDYSESEGCALVALKDGSFAVLYQSEDTSGHGCQCSGDLTFYSSLEDAINLGLLPHDRDEYRKVTK